MARLKQVRIIKKIREASAKWRFVSLEKNGSRYVWDRREGKFFLEWWEGERRRREVAGTTPTEALEAQRRKRFELIGERVTGGALPQLPSNDEGSWTPIAEAARLFLEHVRVHSPDKPNTHRRYGKVLEHFARHAGSTRPAEAVTRKDIDEYKAARSREKSQQHPERIITPRTINFEVSVLRTFFYFLINERGLTMENPCTRFKMLRDPREKSRRRPPIYTEVELERLIAECDAFDRAVFSTLLLTGLREQELCNLTWADVVLTKGRASVRVTGEGKEGFSPKDYEERVIPITDDLAALIKELPQETPFVFPNKNGGRISHLLRRLKTIADRAEVPDATLHKFRHTYATQLLESGCDIVTVQELMGHSDIETTRQYLNPNQDLKRKAVARLPLPSAKKLN